MGTEIQEPEKKESAVGDGNAIKELAPEDFPSQAIIFLTPDDLDAIEAAAGSVTENEKDIKGA